MNVVIVESPAKAKTIKKYLGQDYEVFASYGHVRDLPAKDGSVLPDDNFSMKWETDSKAKKRLTEIATALKNSDKLILATDPDREGEAISWHVLEVLKGKKALKDKAIERVAFNAITKSAIKDAINNPREIDIALVDAYLARRALDYLVGFTLSPILWRKLPGARSAGRVQSVALRLVCEREQEIEVFIPQEYWSLTADCKTEQGNFQAKVVAHNTTKLSRLDIKSENQANEIKSILDQGQYAISSVESKPVKRNPYAPFTTSTLQQDASSKLGFAPSRTMQIAQKLYEGVTISGETTGLITYMRTDGVQISPEAVQHIRKTAQSFYGQDYIPEKPRFYSTKAKNAQEAHEAIRPTDISRTPEHVSKFLDADQLKLYRLIWNRTIASQMSSAVLNRTTIELAAQYNSEQVTLRATGSVLTFDGFFKIYGETTDESEDDRKRLPKVQAGDDISLLKSEAEQHFTEPPPRYSEASLIKKMEELGIGRPSTYAATLSVLKDRDYVEIDKKRILPKDRGRLVTAFLESFFTKYIEYDFTAALEEQLDNISNGELQWQDVLTRFWHDFSNQVDETKDMRITEVLDALNEVLGTYVFPAREDGSDPRLCTTCETGQLSLKVGKFGAFIGCSNYPECKFTRQFSDAADGKDGNGGQQSEDRMLGVDPESSLDVFLKTGRFGPYVQLGEEAKPKRAGLPKSWAMDEMDLDKALSLLALPREVGKHPETGQMITAGIGRYGPFVQHERTYANLANVDDVFTIGLNHAVTLIADKAKSGRGATSQVLKELGPFPDREGIVVLKSGRYGPYINFDKINAPIPRGKDPQSITLEEAIELIKAKEAAGPAKKRGAKKATAKKTAAKKATAKTTESKKTESKKTAAKTSAAKPASKKTTS